MNYIFLCTFQMPSDWRSYLTVRFPSGIRAYPGLTGSLHVKFHDCMCKMESNNAPITIFSRQCIVTLTFDPEIDRAHPWLMGSLCSVMMICVMGKQLCANYCVQSSMHFDIDLWTPILIEHIHDSLEVSVWSFMMIGVKGKQLCANYHFQ